MNITHREIIAFWPSTALLAEEIGESKQKVHQWTVRDSIPAKFWVRLVTLAHNRDIAITYKMLAEAAAKKDE